MRPASHLGRPDGFQGHWSESAVLPTGASIGKQWYFQCLGRLSGVHRWRHRWKLALVGLLPWVGARGDLRVNVTLSGTVTDPGYLL
jgi:hypothetical protein